MIRTIITINRNNEAGLEKTLNSVLKQVCTGFEYVVVDGASTDGSVEVIRRFAESFGDRMKWISEPDKGIYNAMNKGIGMATGDYVQILNSGDCLVSEDVVGSMYAALEKNGNPSILYGNMMKDMPNGTVIHDRCFAGREISFLGFYTGTLNHSPAYIRRSLFEEYGFYDESLKIVSDWKWFLEAIILGKEKPVYADIDVTLFDVTGISETNKALCNKERSQVMSQMIPSTILKDYDDWALSLYQIKRLKRHPWAYKVFWFLERSLMKWEKHRFSKTKEQEWQ